MGASYKRTWGGSGSQCELFVAGLFLGLAWVAATKHHLLAAEGAGDGAQVDTLLDRITGVLVRVCRGCTCLQALLFPDNLLKLSAVRIDTGQPIYETEEVRLSI